MTQSAFFSGRQLAVRLAVLLITGGMMAILAGCGGTQDDAAAEVTAPPARRLAASSTAFDAQKLMNWAEQAFPDYFPGSQPTQTIAPFVFRYYPASGNYVGVADQDVYVFGPMSGNQLLKVGTLAQFECLALPSQCAGPAFPRFSIGKDVAAVRQSDGSYVLWGDDRSLKAFDVLIAGSGVRPFIAEARQVHFGYSVGVVVDPKGQAFGWGAYGRAVGSTQTLPISFENRVPMAFPGEVVQVQTTSDAFNYRTVALLADGTVWAFPGTNAEALEHRPGKIVAPDKLRSLTPPSQIGFGTGTLLHAVARDGTVWRVPVSPAGAPKAVAGASDVVTAHCRTLTGELCVGLRSDGSVAVWPVSGAAQTAPPPLSFDRAVVIPGLSNIREVYAIGEQNVLALDRDGKLWQWEADQAQLESARRAGSFTDVTDLACGPGVCVARRSNGSVWGWGAAYNLLTPGRISSSTVAFPLEIKTVLVP